jgi:hypothetical protein
MADPRYQGSTLTAYIVAVILLMLAIFLGIGGEIDWMHAKKPVEIGSCIMFAIALLAWARAKDWTLATDHYQGTKRKIGFETLTMVVTVITALVAILTLTDAASNAALEKQHNAAEQSRHQ